MLSGQDLRVNRRLLAWANSRPSEYHPRSTSSTAWTIHTPGHTRVFGALVSYRYPGVQFMLSISGRPTLPTSQLMSVLNWELACGDARARGPSIDRSRKTLCGTPMLPLRLNDPPALSAIVARLLSLLVVSGWTYAQGPSRHAANSSNGRLPTPVRPLLRVKGPDQNPRGAAPPRCSPRTALLAPLEFPSTPISAVGTEAEGCNVGF